MRATIAILMAILIRPVLPLAAAFLPLACAQETPPPQVNPQETIENVVVTQLMKRAEQGDSLAQFNLGLMYYRGQGVAEDDGKAARWYRAAAEQGDTSAQYLLGLMYYKGEGVPKDYVLAHMWFNLVASGQPGRGGARLRDAIAEQMTPEQTAKAQRLAREFKPKRSGSQ